MGGETGHAGVLVCVRLFVQFRDKVLAYVISHLGVGWNPWLAGSQFLDQGLNLGQGSGNGIVITRPPGISLSFHIFNQPLRLCLPDDSKLGQER